MSENTRTRKRVRPAGSQPGTRRRPERGKTPDQLRRTRGNMPRSSRARRRKRNRRILGFLLVLLVLAAIVGAILWIRYSPSKEKADLKEYYGVSNDDDLAVVLDNQLLGAGGKVIDNVPYIEYTVLRDNISDRFYWDSNENVLLYTLPNGNVSVQVGESTYTEVNKKKTADCTIVKTEGQTAYIALPFIKEYADIQYAQYEDPTRVMIVSQWGKTKQAEIKKDTQVRRLAGVKSPVLRDLKADEKVTVLEKLDDWKKVRTSDGMIGYVKANRLKNEKTTELTNDEYQEPEYTSISKDYTINMAWNNVTNTIANNSVLQLIAGTKGVTTLAPTWYNIADTDGNLKSISSADYVNYAHQSNMEVWAVLRDFQGGVDSADQVYQVLSYTSKRTKLINQVIADALQTGVDGINLDFELISTECGEHYVQFVRELGVKCRQNGLVFSVDNYVPMSYNAHYNIKEQGIVADYVVLMGYDEHTNNSEETGSVSSYGYVKDGIEKMLENVSKDKLIVGIPFYTRLWTEKSSGDFTSQALGMADAQDAISKAGATATWDKSTRQNYAEWETDEGTDKIWLEDAASIEEKMKLIHDQKLAGVAEWRLGYETSDIWDLILKYVN